MLHSNQALMIIALVPSFWPVSAAVCQEIIATPLAKEAPAQIPGGGIQIDIYNNTNNSQRLRVREPGGNWYVFSLPAGGGLNLRCGECTDHFEASTLDDARSVVNLIPGNEYRFLSENGHGRILVEKGK